MDTKTKKKKKNESEPDKVPCFVGFFVAVTLFNNFIFLKSFGFGKKNTGKFLKFTKKLVPSKGQAYAIFASVYLCQHTPQVVRSDP